MEIPFVGPSFNLDSRPSGVQRTVNLVPVPQEPGNERTAWVFKDVPGIVEAVSSWPGVLSDPAAIALFHFTNAEFSGPTSATDQTGATWTASSTDWLLPASSPSPKFGSGYLRGPSGVGAAVWTRDAVQVDPNVPSVFARARNDSMAIDLWAYVSTGSIGSSFLRFFCVGDVLLEIVISGANPDVIGVAGGNAGISLSAGPAPLDQWFHVRMNYDGTTARLALAGTVMDSAIIDLSGFTLIDSWELTANSTFLDLGPFLDEAYVKLGDAISTGDFTPPTQEWTIP